MIRLSAMSLTSSDSVQDLKVKERGCLFPNEQPPGVPLRFYSEYSHPTCLFECALTLAAHLEGCTPWYLPRLENSTMCDPWEAARFTKFLETTNSSQCLHCLPDCEATTYTASTSSTPIRRCDSRNLNLNPFCSLDNKMNLAPWLEDVVTKYRDSVKFKESMTYDVFENDIALLNVYFGESTAMGEHYVEKEVSYHSNLEYERSLKRTTIEILVDMAAWFGEKTQIF